MSGHGQLEKRLAAQITSLRSWLYGRALPLWADIGIDGDYGFAERLSLDGSVADVGYKRLFVQARQVYVFSHAHLTGYAEGLATARKGWEFMCHYGLRSEGGWVRRLGRRGQVLDPTLDLYVQAMALFATAWWVRASGDLAAIAVADRTLAAVDHRLALGGGWLSERGPGAALLQNPHMHLLEALLALYQVTGEARFKVRASTVLELFESAFFDADRGTLAEYFENDWQRAAGERGRIVEPGHHYEWVWLLHQASTIIDGADSRAQTLFDFAERFGGGRESGLIFDEVCDDGMTRSPSYRLWPTMEALKAHLARFEAGGTVDVSRLTQTLDGLLTHFLGASRVGIWTDRLTSRLEPAADMVPASSLYHIFLALSELFRLEAKLRAAGAVA